MRVRSVLLAVGMMGLSLSTSHGQSGDAAYDNLVQQSKSLLAAGSADQALTLSQASITLSPARWEAYEITGVALTTLHRYDEATVQFGKALAYAPAAEQAEISEELKKCALGQPAGPGPTVMAPPPPPAQPVAKNPQPKLGAVPQAPEDERKTLEQSLIRAINAQQETIQYNKKKDWGSKLYNGKSKLQDNNGRYCQIQIDRVFGVHWDSAAVENPFTFGIPTIASLDHGVLDFTFVDPLSISIPSSGPYAYPFVEFYSSHHQNLFTGFEVTVSDIGNSDPITLPAECDAKGKYLNGKKCTWSPLGFQGYDFLVPGGADAAKAIADQIRHLAQACQNGQSAVSPGSL